MRRFLGREWGTAWPPGQASYPPLVDMLTILLFYLLQTYSLDPAVRPDDEDFQLPRSAHEDPVRPAVDVDVTLDAIYIDGERATSSRYYMQHDEALIMELYERLQGRGSQRVNVRADGRVPYLLLDKVLVTLRQAGVQHLSLVALNRHGI